ncbi:MAG: GIY-YIG nuclease family protein [Nostoc sp.]|uniref:GIY-YIG nuclease family protein n=1 Tax=Nostoc sp. TaxID=1180 RepID=UPI002FEF69FD
MVYFIENTETKHIKIGFSDRVAKRLGQLQVGNSQKLRLVFQMYGDRETEASIHQKLKKYRIRGDWFHAIAVEEFFKLN